LRFFWRQLTSMRTALLLLLLLALAAVPGSLVPQTTADPNGVSLFKVDHPDLYRVLDFLQVFSTYTSVWFSAIYILLFVSLVGCVLPRAKHHLDALRSKPPRTPANLTRMAGYRTSTSTRSAAVELDSAEALLKRSGYRVARYTPRGAYGSVSAERGYLRETGNLVFHMALVGILIAIGVGGSFGFTGQRLVVTGEKFVNTLGDYDSISPGRFVTGGSLEPYRIRLDSFHVTYETANPNAIGQVTDYTADVTVTDADGTDSKQVLKVNSPLEVGGTQVYLLGNGYAPHIKVTSPDGDVVFDNDVPFLPQDAALTSTGVIKIADGLDQQLGMVGFFYPTAPDLSKGQISSQNPDLKDPELSLLVYGGDLGIDSGTPRSVYSLDTDGMTPLATDPSAPSLILTPGKAVDLPNGLGTIEMTGVDRYISLDVHHDPTQGFVLLFAVLVLAGLLTGLFIPRRRVWISVIETDDGVRVEYAGLARGEDPGLESAVEDIARRHSAARDRTNA
jgi:cytochrome c biogenesis protein